MEDYILSKKLQAKIAGDIHSFEFELSKINQDNSLELFQGIETDNCGYERNVIGKIKPKNHEHLKSILECAVKLGVKLYPYSKGKNWGFGGHLPVTDDVLLLDLGCLKKINNYDSDLGTVTVEPGVTQEQLADYLKALKSNYFIDCTGSGKTSSVLGNALERGVGYQALRIDTLLNLEILLPNGEIVQTGYSHYENSKVSNTLAHGVGPSLQGLFTQANFGIVLSGTFKLCPRKEYELSLSISIESKSFKQLMLDLRSLKEENTIDGIIHVANARRCETTFVPILYKYLNIGDKKLTFPQIHQYWKQVFGKRQWCAIIHLSGPRSIVAAKKKHVFALLSSYSKIVSLSKKSLRRNEKLAKLFRQPKLMATCKIMRAFLDFSYGVPGDHALPSCQWSLLEAGKDVESTASWEPSMNSGFHYAAFVIPLKEGDLQKSLEINQYLEKRYRFKIAVTYNIIDSNTVELVFTCNYSLEKLEKNRAHNLIKALYDKYIESGYYPYRCDIENMDKVFKDTSYWRLIKLLKKTLDPHDTISPGRYCPK